MSLVFIDGFDHYDTASVLKKYEYVSPGDSGSTGSNDFQITTARNGNGAMTQHTSGSLNGTGPGIRGYQLNPTDPTTIIAGYAAKFTCPSGFGILQDLTNAASATRIFGVVDGVTDQVWFRLDNAGTISAYRGTTSSTLLGTTSVALSTSTWHYLEFKVLVHASAGTVDVRIDGVNRLSLSGIDTMETSLAQWTGIRMGQLRVFGAVGGGAGVASFFIDDLYVLDGDATDGKNAFLGDQVVGTSTVIGAGSTTEFTPSAGSNYQNVDDTVADDDSTYNESNVLAEVDLFDMSTIASDRSINGLQVTVDCYNTDSGPLRLKAVAKIGATTYLSSVLAIPPASYHCIQSPFALSPATSVNWTPTEYNAAEIGYSVAAPV